MHCTNPGHPGHARTEHHHIGVPVVAGGGHFLHLPPARRRAQGRPRPRPRRSSLPPRGRPPPNTLARSTTGVRHGGHTVTIFLVRVVAARRTGGRGDRRAQTGIERHEEDAGGRTLRARRARHSPRLRRGCRGVPRTTNVAVCYYLRVDNHLTAHLQRAPSNPLGPDAFAAPREGARP